MPLPEFLQSMRGQCRHCGQQAGVFQRDHQECQKAHRAGWQEMVSLATQAATTHSFNEANLRAVPGRYRPTLPRHRRRH